MIPVPHSKLELYDSNNFEIVNDIICSMNSKESTNMDKTNEDDGCYMYFKLSVDSYGGKIFKLVKSK